MGQSSNVSDNENFVPDIPEGETETEIIAEMAETAMIEMYLALPTTVR